MPTVDVVVSTTPSSTIRARQVSAMFDVPQTSEQELRWVADVPIETRPWNVGLIVGPSGCGKTTVARALFPNELTARQEWRGASVLDDFPDTISVQNVADICMAVGFNTIPAWLRPYHVLSNGEQFRVSIARLLATNTNRIVVDEFTSVVDRQTAKIASHAVQKYMRRHDRQFVAVSCHYDIEEWLQPDWVFEPATNIFRWRSLQRRPALNVTIQRVPYAFWRLFARYHYLTAELVNSAQCFCAFIDEQPVAFAGVLYRPHPRVANIYGVSRLVTLPDFQGLGLAFVLTDTLGSAFKALNKHLHTYPAHPALIRGFDRSANWTLQHKPGVYSTVTRSANVGRFGGRPCAVFRYTGDAMQDREHARALLNVPSINR